MVSVVRARLHSALGRFVIVAAEEPLGQNPRALRFSDEAHALRFLEDVAATGDGHRALGELYYQLTVGGPVDILSGQEMRAIAGLLALGSIRAVPLDAIEPDPNQVASVGINPRHAERLMEVCRRDRMLLVIRDTNAQSLKYHDQKGVRAKPKDVKFKTGKQEGLVVRPPGPESSWPEHLQQNWAELQKDGWRFEEDGLLRDRHGNTVHGDYDVQGAYRVTDEGYYDQIPIKPLLERLNREVCPEREMFQHGANDDGSGFPRQDDGTYGPGDNKEGNVMDEVTLPDGTISVIMWRKTEDNEKFLVFHPTGASSVMQSAAELRALYEARGLNWLYSF
jgi:hypothetical protein